MTSFPQKDPTRVLIVDDHPAIWKALSYRMADEADLVVAGTVATVNEAMIALHRKSIDVAVVDLSLPDNGGMELLSKLQEEHPDVRALVFSVHDEELYAERALELGAKGYLMKTAPVGEIIQAIREVGTGHIYLSENMREQALAENSEGNISFSLDNLTSTQLAIFEALGRGDSPEKIADALDMSLSALKKERRELRKALGLESLGQLLQYATAWLRSDPDAKE